MLGENEQVIRHRGHRSGWGVVAMLVALMTAACTADSDSGTTPSTAPSTPPPSASPAVAPPDPELPACYRLTLAEATAATSAEPSVPCSSTWTARTFSVGSLDGLVDGHLFAVDSEAIQRQAANKCPRRLGEFLGGDIEALRLSTFRSVWFTPSVEESDAGANWLRCDVVALARPDKLAKLTGNVKGALDGDISSTYGLCGTAAPDDRDFERVICAEKHSWRALETVDLAGAKYPGAKRVRAAGVEPCTAAARAEAADALDFQWGYEWPTRSQWAGDDGRPGQKYGVCWAPANGS